MAGEHELLTGEQLHEAFQYVAASDPGAVGAGKYWLDTSGDPYVLKRRNGTDDGWITVGSAGGGGDVVGPGSATDNAITRFDGTGGKTVQNSLVTVDDSGGMNIPAGQTYNIDGSPHTHETVLVLLDVQTPSGVSTVTFSSIPDTYRTLIIEYTARSDVAALALEAMRIALNSDTTDGDYRQSRDNVYGTGSPASTASAGEATRIVTNVPAATAITGGCVSGRIEIPFYSDTTFWKNIRAKSTMRIDDSSYYQFNMDVGISFESTSAISSISLILNAGNFVAGSTFALYAVADAPF